MINIIEVGIVIAAGITGYWLVSAILSRPSKHADKNFSYQENHLSIGAQQNTWSNQPIQDCWYQILEVAIDADLISIQQAYYKKIAHYQTDRTLQSNTENRLLIEQKMQSIQAAYDYALTIRKSG